MDVDSLLDVIEHGFQESPKSVLIVLRDTTILIDQLDFFGYQTGFKRTRSQQNETYVDPKFSHSEQVSSVGIPRTPLIAPLGVAIHTAGLSKIFLAQAQTNPFFAQPIPDRSFRR